MAKHAPGTPLPWIFVRSVHGARALVSKPVFERAGPKANIGTGRIARSPQTPKRAADFNYLAHAANAYPKLVEALRVATEHAALFTGDGCRGSFPPEVLNQHGEVSATRVAELGRALLREIGED